MNLEPGAKSPPHVSAYQWTSEYLDALFAYLGFHKQIGVNTVDYVKEQNGRSATVQVPSGLKTQRISEDAEYHDLAIFFEVSSSLMTNLALIRDESFAEGATEQLQKGMGNVKVNVDTTYHGFQVWAHDEEWAGRFLNDPIVKEKLASHLFDSDRNPKQDGFNLSPKKARADVWYAPAKLTAEKIEEVISLLVTLAEVGESSPPTKVVHQNFLEQLTGLNRTILILLALVIGVPCLLSTCGFLIFLMFYR